METKNEARGGVLNDNEIRLLCEPDTGAGMITPFIGGQNRGGNNGGVRRISYGTSSFGYDARLAEEVKIFKDPPDCFDDLRDDIDPSDMRRTVLSTSLHIFAADRPDQGGRSFVRLPPRASALAHTVERFKIPRDVIAICLGKSTYARAGIIVNCTPLEPGWEGIVTLEIVNTTPRNVRLWINEGICQFVFLTGNPPTTSYADRAGKYQGQTGITLPRA